MHPEIEKFWEDGGFTIIPGVSNNQTSIKAELEQFGSINWYANGSTNRINCIATALKQAESVLRNGAVLECQAGMNYFFQGQKYSEEEMLRIVRLKAFT